MRKEAFTRFTIKSSSINKNYSNKTKNVNVASTLTSEFSFSLVGSLDLSCLTKLLWTLVLFKSRIDVLYVSTVFTSCWFKFLCYNVFLLVLQISLFLVVEFCDLSQLADLVDTFLIHDKFGFLLDLFKFLLHSDFFSDLCFHNFLGNSGIDSHQSFLFLWKLFFGDRSLLVVMFLFIFSEPFGQLVVIFEWESSITIFYDFLFWAISEHFFSDS